MSVVEGGEVPFTGPNAGQLPDDAIERGLREIMLNPSGNNPNAVYGYTSNPQPEAAPDPGPTLEQLEELERARAQVAAQPQQNFQQLYGQSENEKGELRRALQAKEDQQNQLALQNQMLQAQLQNLAIQMSQPPATPPAPNFGQPQFGPPQSFFGKDRTEVLLAGEAEERLLPALYSVYQEAQAARAQAQALEQQLISSKKMAAGITPLVEFQVASENPWVNSLTGSVKVDAIASILASKKAATPAPQVPNPPTPPASAMANQRVLYVEGARPVTNNEPRFVSPQLALEQEWAATYNLPLEGGKREEAQRAILLKHGAQQVSGWRDPNILASR